MVKLRIQILATGEFLTLSTDGLLTIQINSTLFNSQDDFLTSKSFPGTAPLEPNKAKIKNAHLILTDASLRTFKVLAWLGNLPWKTCDFKFTISNGAISYVLLLDASLIASDLSTRMLSGLGTDGDVIYRTFDTANDFRLFMNSTATAAPGTLPVVFFPFKNDGAYIDAAYEAAPDAYSPTTAYGVDVKFLYTNNHIYVVTTATTAGMNPVDNPDHFNDITVYSDIVIPVSKYFNAWQIDSMGVGSFIVDNEADPVKYTKAPAWSLPYILKRIAKFYGYEPTGKWLLEERANRIMMQSLIPVDTWHILPDFYFFMPNVGVNEFLIDVRTEFGLLIDFDDYSKTCVIESIQNLVKGGDVIDLRKGQTTSYNETGAVPDAFRVTQSPDDKDNAYSDADKADMPVLTVGDVSGAANITPISLTSAPTKMIEEGNPDDAALTTWSVPWMKQPIVGAVPMDQISSLQAADRHNFKVRFLYYNGMKTNDAGFNYPSASTQAIDSATGQVISLALTAESTSFLPVREFYNYQYRSKPAEIEFMLTAKQLFDISVNKRVLISDFNFACVSCLISQVTAGVGNNKDLIPVKVLLYPQVLADNKQQVLPPEVVVTPPPVDNGLVYLRLTFGDYQYSHETHPTDANFTARSIDVSFWEDEAGTIPKDVTDLPVRLQTVTTDFDPDGGSTSYTGEHTYSCSGTDVTLFTSAVFVENLTDGSGWSTTWSYSVLPSAYYNIIT